MMLRRRKQLRLHDHHCSGSGAAPIVHARFNAALAANNAHLMQKQLASIFCPFSTVITFRRRPLQAEQCCAAMFLNKAPQKALIQSSDPTSAWSGERSTSPTCVDVHACRSLLCIHVQVPGILDKLVVVSFIGRARLPQQARHKTTPRLALRAARTVNKSVACTTITPPIVMLNVSILQNSHAG